MLSLNLAILGPSIKDLLLISLDARSYNPSLFVSNIINSMEVDKENLGGLNPIEYKFSLVWCLLI